MKPPNNDARHIYRSILGLLSHFTTWMFVETPHIIAWGFFFFGPPVKWHPWLSLERTDTMHYGAKTVKKKNPNVWKRKDARVSEAASVCGVSVAAERHKKRGEPCVVSVLN